MVTLTPGSVLLLCTDIVELYSLQRLWGSCAVVDFLFFFPPTPQGQGIWFGLSAVHHSHNRDSWTLNSRHSVYWPMLHTYCIRICTDWHLFFFSIVFVDNYRAPWTSWSRRQTWPWWWGAAAGESSSSVLSLSVQVNEGILERSMCSFHCERLWEWKI